MLVIQRGYRRWRTAREALTRMGLPLPAGLSGRLRREGWRLAWMAGSLLAMTALVFAVLLGAPPVLIGALRGGAVLAVAAVVWLSVVRER